MKIMLLLIILGTSPLLATEGKVLWTQDFDNQVPGEHPEGWREKKQPEDAVAVITNTEGGPNDCQLLLDRLSGKKTVKATPLLKNVKVNLNDKAPWLVFSACFKLKGKGAKGGLEIRDNSLEKRLVIISFGNKYGPNMIFATGRWKHKTVFGQYQPDTWYRVTTRIPWGEKAETVSCRLEVKSGDVWQPIKSADLPFKVKNYTPLGFYLNMPKNGSQLILDNLSLTSEKSNHHEGALHGE